MSSANSGRDTVNALVATTSSQPSAALEGDHHPSTCESPTTSGRLRSSVASEGDRHQ
ncbi:hypothetical protein [Streptomyces sp. NPDC059171]|uniref:hypothetical protein n=1 Tax=Streptomyces sp. NPDC059171 TaxID=3346755 RepID=UPI003693D763